MSAMQPIEQWLWQRDAAAISPAQQRVLPLLRFVYALALRIADGDLSLRAQSLVYTTLLSLVPLMAVGFSVLKAFGVHNQLQPILLSLVDPLGEKGPEIVARLIAFVENMQVGVLGFVGLAMLFYNVISTLHKIESSFNSIWHNIKPRSLLRRFTDYTSVLLVGPVFVVVALGMTASMTSARIVQAIISVEPFGTVYYAIGVVMPYVLITTAFYFVYIFMPNTRVRARAAFVGAFVAGTLWKTAGWGFATFVANSTQYHAVYSGFAIVLIFMIWVYLSWLIVLLGAQIAFFVQNPVYMRPLSALSDRIALKEQIALALILDVARRFHDGVAAPNAEMLAATLDLPATTVAETIENLRRAQWIIESDADPPTYVPARDLATSKIADLFASIRGDDDVRGINWAVPRAVQNIYGRVQAATRGIFRDETLADVLNASAESRAV